MSCCKNKKKTEISPTNEKKTGNKVISYLFNFIFFLIVMAILSVLIIPIFGILLFRVMVLNKNEVNMLPTLIKIFKSNKSGKTEYDKTFDGVSLLNNLEPK